MEQSYRELLLKFFAEEISDEELNLLKIWLSQSAENKRIFDEENELWRESSKKINIDHFNTDEAWSTISMKYNIGAKRKSTLIFIPRAKVRFFIAAATITLLVVSGSFVLWLKAKNSLFKYSDFHVSVSTNYGDKANVYLPDSSEIILNSGSKIQYDANYNKVNRQIELSGEAFFIVKTNPLKPFIVNAGKLKVFATGTRFNISAYDNESNVETTLEEGIVNVAINGGKSITLMPDQQVIFSKPSGLYKVAKIDPEVETSWRENKLRLVDASLRETLQKISRKYNVTFEVTNKDLYNLKYTATFIDESLREVMDMLKVVSPINYKIYYRTTVTDKQYMKPRVVIGRRK